MNGKSEGGQSQVGSEKIRKRKKVVVKEGKQQYKYDVDSWLNETSIILPSISSETPPKHLFIDFKMTKLQRSNGNIQLLHKIADQINKKEGKQSCKNNQTKAQGLSENKEQPSRVNNGGGLSFHIHPNGNGHLPNPNDNNNQPNANNINAQIANNINAQNAIFNVLNNQPDGANVLNALNALNALNQLNGPNALAALNALNALYANAALVNNNNNNNNTNLVNNANIIRAPNLLGANNNMGNLQNINFMNLFPQFINYDPQQSQANSENSDDSGSSQEGQEYNQDNGAQNEQEEGSQQFELRVGFRLNKLKRLKVQLVEGQVMCCNICGVGVRVGEKRLSLPCGHAYHHQCAKLWLEISRNCPTCNYKIEKKDIFN